MKNARPETRRSDLPTVPTITDLLSLRPPSLGHGACTAAHTVGRPEPQPGLAPGDDIRLGEPLNIRQVARLIGCSVWSVRQRHVRHGLPHFRSSPSGKLIFYRDQVVAWLLENQIRERRSWL